MKHLDYGYTESDMPFLKWAGGKRWLTSKHPELFPKQFTRYFEVFLGGGAVFFAMSPKRAVLSDINEDLIECYIAVRDEWENVVKHLKSHHAQHSQEYYYNMRSSRPKKPATRAARLIYLNRTCWNGLYRVNLKGQFNVPIGTKTSVFSDSDDFERLSRLLSKTDILASDFETIINRAGAGDFVFADPPYTVRHNLNGFVKYNEKIFRWEDQLRLHDCLSRANKRGALVLLTNANHPTVANLYKNDFEQVILKRSSVIAGNSFSRGHYEELVVRNF